MPRMLWRCRHTRPLVSSSYLTISGHRGQVSPLPKVELFLPPASSWMEEGMAVAHQLRVQLGLHTLAGILRWGEFTGTTLATVIFLENLTEKVQVKWWVVLAILEA